MDLAAASEAPQPSAAPSSSKIPMIAGIAGGAVVALGIAAFAIYKVGFSKKGKGYDQEYLSMMEGKEMNSSGNIQTAASVQVQGGTSNPTKPLSEV